MFGIGIYEILLVLAIALFVVGPSRLPEAMRQLGLLTRKIKKYALDLRRDIMAEEQPLEEIDLEQKSDRSI